MATKVHIVKAMVFPVVMYGCESWTIKKAEHQRIYAFELWCWRRFLSIPWKSVNPEGNQPWIFIKRTNLEVEAPIHDSNSHVWMWELDPKESWMLKNWFFRIVVLEKTLENPLESKEIKPVNPKGSQPWIRIGRTDAEAEAPKLWPSDMKSWLIGKDPDAGKDWGQEKRVTENEMVVWHYQLNGHEFKQILGDSEG